MRISLLLALCASTLSLLPSCRQQRYVYTASKINAPMLADKGDARVNASFSFGNGNGTGDSSHNRGYDLQTAYAITEHFGLMAGFHHRKESDKFDAQGTRRFARPFSLSKIAYSRRSLELGAGYFFSPEVDEVLSLYGGIAFGGFSLYDRGFSDSSAYERNFRTVTKRLFLQPGFSFLDEREINFDISTRFSFLSFDGVRTSYTNDELAALYLEGLESSGAVFFVEPSFTVSVPLAQKDWLRAEASGSLALTSALRSNRMWCLSVGITWNPGKAFRGRGGVRSKE